MKLYGFGNSRSFRIIWMFMELNVKFEYVKLNPNKGQLEERAFLKLNPSGKVPVLIDGTLVLTESAAIITYLGDTYANQVNKSDIDLPAFGTQLRATYNQWCFFALSEFEQPLWTMAKHQFALPDEFQIPSIIKTTLYEFKLVLNILEQGLGENNWILGQKFSAADILLGHSLHWAHKNKIKFKNTCIEAYYARILERKGFKKALDFINPSD